MLLSQSLVIAFATTIAAVSTLPQLLSAAHSNITSGNYTISKATAEAGHLFDPRGHLLPGWVNGTARVDPSRYNSSESYQACMTAVNCEPFHHQYGWRPSFKPGYNATYPYGNGTMSRHLQQPTDLGKTSNRTKRQMDPGESPSWLGLSYGSAVLYYGDQNPCTSVNYAYYVCNEYGCTNSVATLSGYTYTETIAGQGLYPFEIYTGASGDYPGYDMRAALIGSAVTAASEGQTWWSEDVLAVENGYETQATHWFGQGNDYWTMAFYSEGNNYMEGWMDIWTYNSATAFDGGCGLAGAITDLLWTLFGFWGGLLASVAAVACI